MLKKIAALSLAALMLPLSPALAQDLSAMSWDDIVAQAKEEGELTWFQWYFQDRFREQVKAFEAEYGIRVAIPDGDANANFSKFLAEKDRSEGDIDVLSIPGGNVNKFAVEDYLLGPLDAILSDAGKLRYDIEGGVSKGYAVAFWGNQSGIAYNPARIEEEDLPRTIEQFEAFMAAHPQELGFNVENGGSGPAFIESVTRAIVPQVDYASGTSSPELLTELSPAWDWFNAREDQYIITASNADGITRLNSGEFMLVATWEDFLAGLQNKGEVSKEMKFYIPDFGMPGGGNLVGIPANAKHKAAALVFIHWLTSAQTQSTFNQVFGSAPQHPDADAAAALLTMADRTHSIKWAAKPLGDDVKTQFIEKVTLD